MARPREFEEADVLERARDVFWGHGVAATSISALSEATGLSVGSIYKAFKSKDELCSRTLEDYLGKAQAWVEETLESGPTPLAGIQTWLEAMIEQAVDTSPTRGCYAVELAAERAAVDEGVRQLLVDHDDSMRQVVGNTVRQAVELGELRGDPEGITRLMITAVNGLQVDARKGITEKSARLTVDTLLAAFGA